MIHHRLRTRPGRAGSERREEARRIGPGARVILLTIALVAGPRPLIAQSPELPVQLTGALIGDVMRTLQGGTGRATESLVDVDLQLRLNGPALGWRGGYAFLYVLGNDGGDPSDNVGDFQGVDNIAAPSTWKVFEAWIEQHFLGERASVLLGLYDLNSEFDVLGSARLFLNSSFGVGPDYSQSGLNGPSIFPTTSLALRLKALPRPRWRVEVAMLDGVPGDPGDPHGTHVHLDSSDGLLLACECAYYTLSPGVGRDLEEREGPLHAGRIGREDEPAYGAKLAVGSWGYTRRLAPGWTLGSTSAPARSWGVYMLGEARIDRGGGADGSLWLFGRTGLADDQANQVGAYVGGGLSWRKRGRGRSGEVGVGFAAAGNGGAYLDARRTAGIPTERWEVAVELSSLVELTDHLAVQPDVQWILNPGMDPHRRNALLLGIRGLISAP